MKILYVIDTIVNWGGLERIIVEKVNYLAENYDFEMHIVTVDQGCHPIPYPLSPKVTYQDLGIRFHQQYSFHGLFRLYKKVCLYNYNVRKKVH